MLSSLYNARQATEKRILLIVHDNLLPLIRKPVCDAILHLDLPLSQSVFVSRTSILLPDAEALSCHFLITSPQRQSLLVLFSHFNAELVPQATFVNPEDQQVASYFSMQRKKHLTEKEEENIDINELTEEEAHSLFYQNPVSEIVEEKEQNFVEVDLKSLDVEELENLDEKLAALGFKEEEPCEQPIENQHGPVSKPVPVSPPNVLSTIPSFVPFDPFSSQSKLSGDILHSVFNPFNDPGVLVFFCPIS